MLVPTGMGSTWTVALWVREIYNNNATPFAIVQVSAIDSSQFPRLVTCSESSSNLTVSRYWMASCKARSRSKQAGPDISGY